jgi:hypothetical protein
MDKKNHLNKENDRLENIFYPILEDSFFKKGIGKVRATFYKSMIQPLKRPMEPVNIAINGGLILFFETDIKYPQGGGLIPIASEHKNFPSIELKLGKFFISKGIHMAVLINFDNEDRTNEIQHYFEGLLSIPWKNSTYYAKIASYLFEKENNKIIRRYSSPTFLNPSCPGQRCFSNKYLDFLGLVNQRIMNSSYKKKIVSAVRWFRLAYPNYLISEQWTDSKEFILCWTALEVLCGGSNTASNIKKKFSAHFNISTDDIEKFVGIGKFYNIRCQMLHEGRDFAIADYQMDILREIFIVYLCLLLKIDIEGFQLRTVLDRNADYLPKVFQFHERH